MYTNYLKKLYFYKKQYKLYLVLSNILQSNMLDVNFYKKKLQKTYKCKKIIILFKKIQAKHFHHLLAKLVNFSMYKKANQSTKNKVIKLDFFRLKKIIYKKLICLI